MATATLDSLAGELIELILDELCINHINQATFRAGYYSTIDARTGDQLADQEVSLGALANLCRTSKQFQHLTTWRLYYTLPPATL